MGGVLDIPDGLGETNESLRRVPFLHRREMTHLVAPREADSYQEPRCLIATAFITFLPPLILSSGMINFLKPIIQSSYNRNHELALHKGMGATAQSLFGLLFIEVF